jgi:hypothetical protein
MLWHSSQSASLLHVVLCQVLGPCLEPTRTENWHLWCVRALLVQSSDLATVSLRMHFASVSSVGGKKIPGWIWNGPFSCRIKGTEFRIVYQDENQAEVSFTRNWDPSLEGKAVPLNIDKRWLTHKFLNSAISSVHFKRVQQSKRFCAGSSFSVAHPGSTPMVSMSIRKDGLISAWERRGWLSSCGKTCKP